MKMLLQYGKLLLLQVIGQEKVCVSTLSTVKTMQNPPIYVDFQFCMSLQRFGYGMIVWSFAHDLNRECQLKVTGS